MKTGLNLSVAVLFMLPREIYCSPYTNDSLTTASQTLYSDTTGVAGSSCFRSTNTITYTVTVTRLTNNSTNADDPGETTTSTDSTTIPYDSTTTPFDSTTIPYDTTTSPSDTRATGISTCIVTVVEQKTTVTVFVDLPAQTTTEITTDYVGKTTVLQSSCSESVFQTTTVTGPASTTIFITSTIFEPIAKREQEAALPGELMIRDVVWITVYEPAATIVQSVCSTTTETLTVTIPGQKTTVVTFVTYTQSHSPSNTSPAASSSEAASPFSSLQTKAAVSQATPTPTPTTSTLLLQPGQTLTTSFGGAPATIINLPGGSSALVNGGTLSQGQATTINGEVISVGPSGVVVAPLPSAFTTTITTIGSAPLSVVELPGAAVVDGTTLSSGGADITINGVIVTYGESGLIAVSTGSGTTTSINIGGVIMSVFGYTELGSTLGIAFGSQTLAPGGIVTVSGTIYTFPTSGTVPIAVSTAVTGSSGKNSIPWFVDILALMFSILQALV